MCVEYGGEPGCSAKFFVVPGEVFQGLLDTAKHQGIGYFLVPPCQGPKLPGEGKGGQVVFGRESLVQLIFDPLLVFGGLIRGISSQVLPSTLL